VEIINLRVQAVGGVRRPEQLSPRSPADAARRNVERRVRQIRLDGVVHTAAVYRRAELTPDQTLDGPAVVVQYDTTVVVPPGFRVAVDRWLNLVGEAR
jgi:N-methylhydantoinase A